MSPAKQWPESRSAEMAMAEGKTLPGLLAEQEQALADFERLGGYTMLARMDAVFDGLNQDTLVEILGGGQETRLALALLVGQGCNFLLLDEPINHLDIPSRSRFEQAMTAFQGSVLAIAHDRYFIERFASGLWAIEGETIRTYGSFEDMRCSRERV